RLVNENYDRERGLFGVRDEAGRFVKYPMDLHGWALSMLGPEMLEREGVDVPKMLKAMANLDNFFIGQEQRLILTHWLGNMAMGLRLGADYSERKSSEAVVAKDNARADSFRNSARDARDTADQVQALILSFPRQSPARGGGAAYAYLVRAGVSAKHYFH